MSSERTIIPDHVRTYVEGELRAYRGLKAKMEQLKRDQEDIYHRSNQPRGEPVKGSHKGDPTATAAMLLERNSKEMNEIKKRIERIEAGLNACDKRQKELIEIKYFSVVEPSDGEVMEYMYIGYRTGYYKLKFETLERAAKGMKVL